MTQMETKHQLLRELFNLRTLTFKQVDGWKTKIYI